MTDLEHRGQVVESDGAARGPRVCILLASYNGERWIEDQLNSIRSQVGVAISVVVSDDASSDRTPEILEAWKQRGIIGVLPRLNARLGSANRNFLRLISEAPLSDAAYVALSDQDDLWHPDKLARAINEIRASWADAYSSNVIAFWPDGRRCVTEKGGAQREFDHLFESPGPGCTFVFRVAAFEQLRRWVRVNFARIQGIPVHDWLIYAYARREGWKWHIDPRAGLLYRQHGANLYGVNSGSRAALWRLQGLLSGRFRNDVLAIAEAVDDRSWVSQRLRRLDVADRVRLLAAAFRFRRRPLHSLILGLSFLVMGRGESRR